MAVKRFTEEEMELLRKNPYTYRVTYNMLLLTYNVPIVMDSLVGSIESDMGIKAT